VTQIQTIDPAEFRATLGHYPTGVALITAIDGDGEPVGMVVGSFTSVSLDPPLIAFFPTRTSERYQRLRTATSFCVNVLAYDQGDLCRTFAGRGGNDFSGVTWSPSPSGAPVLDGAVAWIDCTFDSVADGGDHLIVLGRVRGLGVVNPVAPLLFFQGGYGRFAPLSLVVPAQADLVVGVRLAELIRDDMAELVADVPSEATAMVPVGEDLVVVAAAVGAGAEARTTLGRRVPLRPPLGEPYVAWQDHEVERWLDRRVAVDPCTREHYLERLQATRERGLSISLGRLKGQVRFDVPRMARLLDDYSSGDLTPARERDLHEALAQASKLYEPRPLRADERYDVHSLIAPLLDKNGHVPLMLRLSQLPPEQTGTEVMQWIDRLLATTASATRRLLASNP
jgi:flavin reductase (DIM6/NTAB) family NADH-FMN oxidoreductase RutF